MPQKNELAALCITAITSEGNGVGRLPDGMAVFVPGTAPGDRLVARLVKVYPRYAYGRLEKLLSPSPDRVEEGCPVSRRCGGCALRHISYEAEKRVKRQLVEDAMVRIGGFEAGCCRPLVATNQVDGYRNKAMYPVRAGKEGGVALGFFAPRSHQVVGHTACLLQPPAFAAIAEAVRGYMLEAGVPCYDEARGTGVVRHLYLRRAQVTGEIMVCLVINSHRLPAAGVLLKKLEGLGLPIASVVCNINRRNTNVILGDKNITLAGRGYIVDELCGVRVRLSPQSFYQVNHGAAELLYRHAARCAGLTGRETLLDLYCGAGTIGLSMARDAGQVIGVEVVSAAVEDARRNAAENGIENARFLCADAGQAAAQLAREGVRPDVVVVDPPRKGCGEAVLAAIAQMAPGRVVMVSCNPATAARDARRLAELGYCLREVTPFDLFPRTMHCEACLLLCRIPNGK